MALSRSRRAKSTLSKRVSQRRLLLERLEERVVLTAQSISPLLPGVPGVYEPSVPKPAPSLEPLVTTQQVGQPYLSAMGPAYVMPDNGSLTIPAGAVTGAVGLPEGDAPKTAEVVPGQWITRFDGLDGPADRQVAALRDQLTKSGLTGIEVTQPLGLPGMVQLKTSPDVSSEQLSASLSTLAGFRYLSHDYKIWGSSLYPNDPLFGEQYALENTGQYNPGDGTYGVPDADIDAPEAWDLTTGSSTVVVGVVDSGIDFTHPDLVNTIWTNPNEVPDNGLDDDSNGYIDDVHGWDFWGQGYDWTTDDDDNYPGDENGHGTHVSGTIGAEGDNALGVAGVAWDVAIMPLRFLGPGNYGWLSDAVRAINYATMMRNNGVNLKVTNHSWGWSGFPFDAVSDAIAAHEQAGILFVTAAGNASSDNDYTPAYPASYPLDNIISVASTDNQDNRSWFSNYGAASVDLGAPGSAVLSTTPSFVYPYTGYSYFWGTSMATPQVTGVAALAWSLAPDATYQQVKDAILNGVDPIPALDGITVSGGRLNAYNTLQQLGISVVSTAPAVDSIVSSPPTQFTVNFSLPVDPASVQAVDLAVNGIPADAVLMEDSDTLTFTFAGTSPVTSEGIQTMAMAPGAIAVDPSAGAQVPFRGFAGTFRYDALQLQVVATNPPTSGGKFVLPGPFSYDVHFNEPVDPNSISTSDLLLTGLDGAAVHGATVAPDGTTATFVIEGIGGEGTLVAQIAAGAITDVYGNPGAAFSASYVVDYGTAPYPVPLTPVAPLGSLIYDPVQYGFIDPAGDTDSFTVAVDPGQTITVLMESSATLRSTVRISGPGNAVLASTTAAAPGADALLQAVRVPGQLAGNGPGPTMYTVTVGGANGTTGQYALRIILNAALETELHNGLSNDTRGSAQNLDSSFIALHSAGANGNSPQPQRGAVLGQITVDAPVVPNADETIGLGRESGNAFPFALDAFGIPSMRYQQIYAALQFPNGGVIDEIRFRRFSGSEPFTDLQLDVQIRLSYAATSVTTASTAFAQNVGENVTTVYDGLLVLSSTDDGTNMPLSFDVVIDVDDAFVYDPARGDLLVDFFVRDSNYAAVTYFAATDDPAVDAATTRIFSSYSVDDEYGTRGLYGGGPYGLVTQIVFDTPPDSGDWYRFDLKSGQSASVALSVLQGHDAQVALVSASGATLAISSPNQATNVDQIISNYVATSTGTYFLKVTSQAGATYSLVVTRNADFDAENNNSIETAQELISSEAAGSRWVLGHIDPGTSGLFSTGNDGTSLITIDSRTGTGSVVGPFGTPGTFTAAFTPDGTLWTIVDGFNVNGAQLATVDPATGVAIRVGSPVWTGSPVFAMDADASGQLYAGGWDGTFFIVDTVTGQMTPIGFMGFFSAMDFAFDNDGVLWALDTGENLYSIDPITGAGTFRSRIVGLNGLAMGLMVDPSDNSLYVTTYTADSNLYRVDPSTGSTELIGPVGIVFPHGGDFEPIVAPEGDFYRISVDGNGTIEMETRTPAYKSGEFQNNLDPVLRLYDAAGNLVATNDNGGSDGRNAKLKYKVPKNSGGVYYVEVAASDAAEQTTQGEYILSVNGTTRTLDAFVVTDTNPADGSRVYTAPREFEVSFNDTVSVPTLQGADFRLNGKPASSVTSVDGDTVRFQNALAFQWTPDLGGNGHYYVLTSGPKGWLDAQAEAVALGGNLVTVNDQLEQNYLKRVFFSGPNEFFTYWTGLNDINQEGVFEWVSGEPVTYTNWNVPYEPNDFGPGEDGTQINWNPFLNNGAWNDLYLSWNLYGIIELTSLPAGVAVAQEGLNTFSVVGGSIKDIQGTPVAAYSGSFVLDTTPPVVVATTPFENEVLPEGPVTVTVTFSESMDTTTIGAAQVPVYGLYYSSTYFPSSSVWSADGKVLTLDYGYLPEDAYELRLVGDDVNFQDVVGLDLDGDLDLVEGGTFVLRFAVDAETRSLPVPLVPVGPLGSLAYQTPYALNGVIAGASDADDFTVDLDSNQTITVLVDGLSSGLRPTVSVYDPNGVALGASESASQPGGTALMQARLASTGGTYTIRVESAAGEGQYSIQLIVNAAVEAEVHGGDRNDDLPGQPLVDAFIDLGNGMSRGAVLGRSDGAGGLGAVAEPFEFLDIRATGQAILQGSDDGWYWLSATDLDGFVFPLLGVPNDNLYVSANGFLYLPANSGYVYALTRDLVIFGSPDAAVYWQVVGSGDEQQLVVQWNDVGFYGYPGADPITFQAVLNETDGSVRFNYLDLQTDIPFLNEGQGATVGVSGYTSSWAYQSFFVPTYDAPNQYVGTGRSTRIAELPQSSDVFAIDLEAGQSMTVSVTGLGYLYGLALELRDDGGNLLALGAYGTGFDAAIRDFVAPTTGTYFVSIRSETVADYSLLVTRDAAVDTEPNNGQFDAQSIGANGGAVGSLWGPFDSDWYRVTVAEGGSLDLAISVPAAGPGEFVNDLVPRLELTDEAGNSLGVVEGDGSMLSTGPLAAGTYFVAVTAAGAAGGEYVLSVTGASTSLPPFSVAFTLPYDGASIRGALTEYTIHFSDLILLTTLTADDVTFNGVPATAVTVAGGDTAVFAVPDGLPEGMITVSIAAGAISDVQGTLLDAFSGVVYTDLAPPRVIASSLQEGDVLAAGGLVVTITFSEAMSPYVYPYAAPLFGQWFGSYFEPVSIEFDATGTVATFTYADLPEDAYTLYLFSWAITDLAGFALDGEPAWPIPPNGTGDGYEYGDFFVNFVTDNDTQSFPQPLVAVPPTDSLILQTPSDSQGTIGFAGDTDTFTIDVDGGQTLTVLLKPGYSLLGTVELWGPGNTFIDSAVGAFWGGEVLLQTVPAAAAGSYSVVISSADGSLGSYAVGLTLNAALEEEPHGGASNNEPGTAQSIEGSFLPPAGDSQRGAVRGVSGDDDVYSFELAVGQSLTAGLAFDTPLTGVYGPRTDYYSYGVVDVALGDVNGDGIPDMVTASIWGWYIGVRLGVGDGSFGDESYAGSAYSPRDIQLEDVDSDGYLDVVVANYDGGYYGAGLSVFLGDGVGNFTTVLNFDVGYGTTAVAVGDVTGDGAPDLVATSDYDSTVKVLTNNGDRTFGAAVSYPVGAYPVDVALADMDGTSGLDIVTANNLGGYNNESLTILFNTGGGMFGPAVGFPAGLYNVALAVDDLNGDGAMDVVTIDSLSSASLYVLLNSGGGTLQSPAVYALDGLGGSSVAIGDVNGDGAPDVIAAAAYNATFTGSTISVFVNSNDGSGSFGASQSVEATYGTSDIDVGDVDSDGHLDLVAASASSSAVSVLLNVTAPTVLTLFAPDGTELPNPSTGTGEFDALLDGFVAPEAGTYSIRVSSPSVPRDYSLVVTRGAAGGGGGANGEESLSLSPLAVSSTAAFPRDTETALDVSRDGTVSPVDALMVINELNRGGFRRLSADGTDSVRKSAYDVNGDGYVSPADALQVINHIARRTVSDDVLRVSPPTGLATSIPMGGRADGRVAATLHENAFGSDLGLDESLTAIVVGGADDVSPATTESDVWDDADSAWLSDDLELAVSSLAGEE